MKLSLSKNLTELKAKAVAKIDAQAEALRSQYITPGSGQAMVYEAKRREAESFMSDQGISPALIPHLVSEADMNGISLFDQAVEYLSMENLWANVSPPIERKRLMAKQAIAAATTLAQLEEASQVDWTL